MLLVRKLSFIALACELFGRFANHSSPRKSTIARACSGVSKLNIGSVARSKAERLKAVAMRPLFKALARHALSIVILPCHTVDWKAAGARVISIDPHRTAGDVWLEETAAEVLPTLVQRAFDDD